jgi:nucleoside-triphosphatase THEP1
VDCAGGDFLWVIKGGPGCGKSEFMSRVAGAAESVGLEVE